MDVQRPSSVGMLPVQQKGLDKLVVHSFTITQENYLQARTGQLIVGETKALHVSELPDLGWDAACQRIFRHKP